MANRKLTLGENQIRTQPEPLGVPEPDADVETLGTLRAQMRRMKSLQSAYTDLFATLDWDSLLDKSLNAAARIADADRASLMVLDDHSDTLFIARAYNLSDDIIAATKVKLGEGVAGWVAQNRQSLLLLGPIDRLRYPNSAPKPHLIASSICVPLMLRDNGNPIVTGVLNVSRSIGAPNFSQEDLELVFQIGGATALAMRNARAYQVAHQHARQSEVMIDVSQRLAEKLDTHSALRAIIERAIELLHCQAGALFVVDAKSNDLICQTVVGSAHVERLNQRMPSGIGIVGNSAREGKALIVNDARADPRFYAQIDSFALPDAQAMLCVPLIRQSRVIGVIQVVNKTDQTLFDDGDQELLQAFAIQSAVALGNAQLYSDLRRSFADTVRIIANAVEARDGITAGHTNRVTNVALVIANELNWTPEQIQNLEIGSLLHDIGKIGMPDRLLFKQGILTDAEYSEMKDHPIVGARMLTGVAALEPVLPYVLYHQERYDGKGYPFGLAGDAIPIEGRLLAVADTFDAMTSNRPYRNGLSEDQALAEIARQRGIMFDPVCVDALISAHQKGKLAGLAQSSQNQISPEEEAA